MRRASVIGLQRSARDRAGYLPQCYFVCMTEPSHHCKA